MTNNKIFVKHRKEIDRIDGEIIRLLKRRLESAEKIGVYKKKHGMKMVDKKREKEILNERIKKSKLSKDFTKRLFLLIIKESKEVQR